MPTARERIALPYLPCDVGVNGGCV